MEILYLDIGMRENVNQAFLILTKNEGRREVHFSASWAFQSVPEIRHHRVGAGSHLLVSSSFRSWKSCDQQLYTMWVFFVLFIIQENDIFFYF